MKSGNIASYPSLLKKVNRPIRVQSGARSGTNSAPVTAPGQHQVDKQPESQLELQPELQPESRPESMEIRVLRQLLLQPTGKAQLSEAMEQKAISGQLNKVIRVLVADQTIEPTIPDKPTSRLQKYRITEKGLRLLEQLDKEGGRS